MRKRIVTQESLKTPSLQPDWLDLAHLAQVEVTSEDAAYPVESALVGGEKIGWRAAESGQQTIRLLFDTPQKIKRIHLHFQQHARGRRTQEFVLRWSAGAQQPFRDIVRQQYNFSTPDAPTEIENYDVDLTGVAVLELVVTPDIDGGAHATLEQLRVA